MLIALRTALVASLLIFALVFPKVGAVLLELNPNIQTAVICTGDRMVTLRLDSDGNPIEMDEVEDQRCLLFATAAETPKPVLTTQVIARTFVHRFVRSETSDTRLPTIAPKLPQGPPALV